MTLKDFKRLIQPIKNKIFLLVGRAILKAINNSEGTQKIQVVALNGETITDIERFQEYGFETYPKTNAEVLCLFFNGNRDHGFAICAHDRRYRPTGLVEGEVVVYTDEDSFSDHRIHFKRNRIIEKKADKDVENLDTSKTVTTPIETHTNSSSFTVDSPQITLGSDSFSAVKNLIDSRFQTLYNNHVHTNGAGGGNTGTPTTTLTSSHMTSKTKAL